MLGMWGHCNCWAPALGECTTMESYKPTHRAPHPPHCMPRLLGKSRCPGTEEWGTPRWQVQKQ